MSGWEEGSTSGREQFLGSCQMIMVYFDQPSIRYWCTQKSEQGTHLSTDEMVQQKLIDLKIGIASVAWSNTVNTRSP
jgi:hypothetical protein